MSDQPGDFEGLGETRSADRSGAALGLALLFIGLAAGALAALMLTPKTGKQMRRSLRRKYEDAREAVDDWGEQAGDWVDKGSDLRDKAADWADTAKKRVQPLAKKFRG